MPMAPSQFADLETLTRGLNDILVGGHTSEIQVTILAREPSSFASTFPSEIVTCQLPDGSQLKVWCKYMAGLEHNAFGHRGGISYEADVYRHVLGSLSAPSITFYGAYGDALVGDMWIVFEYLDESMYIWDSDKPTWILAAAGWLGHFHRESEALLSRARSSFLNRHDADYYLGWAYRTSQLAGDLHQSYPWLMSLCRRFEEVVDILLEPPTIVIHGEYYPKNILVSQGTIYPVDWESTAIAAGEIDLASLFEGWSLEIASACTDEYCSTRWPERTLPDFERRLDVAKMYWDLRWLGEREEWTHQEKARKRFERLRLLGERFGLI